MATTISSCVAELENDPSPRALAVLDYFRAVLDGVAVIPGGMKILVSRLRCNSFVDPEIDDSHFPGADAYVSAADVRPVEIDPSLRTELQLWQFLEAMDPPMQPARTDESLQWAAENPEAQEENNLVILGQKCRDSRGKLCVIVLGGFPGERWARLVDVQSIYGLSRGPMILARPKAAARN